MFGPLGFQEILLILGIALLVFGPRRLPEMGRTLGKALGEFRRATNDLKRSVQFEMDAEDQRQRKPPATLADPARTAYPAPVMTPLAAAVSGTATDADASPAETGTAQVGTEKPGSDGPSTAQLGTEENSLEESSAEENGDSDRGDHGDRGQHSDPDHDHAALSSGS